MKIRESVKMALQGLASNKLRSTLTMLGIIIGVGAVVLLVSITQGVRTYIKGEILVLGSDIVLVYPGEREVEFEGGMISQLGFTSGELTYADARAIEEEAETVKSVSAELVSNVLVEFSGKTTTTQIEGVTPSYPEIVDVFPEQGSFIRELHVSNAARVCVLGLAVADDLFVNVDPVGQRVTISGQRYTVIGVMEERGQMMLADYDDRVYIPITSAIALTGTDSITHILVKAKDPYNVDETVSEVERILSRMHDEGDFSVVTQGELQSLFENVAAILTRMLGAIAGISLLVAGIGIMNIMLAAVTERTREIGIRKAVGARGRDILTEFLIEAVMLSIMGGLIGLILSIIGSLLLGAILPTQLTLWSVVVAFGVALAVGVFFGIYPARRASRQDPIVALRYE